MLLNYLRKDISEAWRSETLGPSSREIGQEQGPAEQQGGDEAGIDAKDDVTRRSFESEAVESFGLEICCSPSCEQRLLSAMMIVSKGPGVCWCGMLM